MVDREKLSMTAQHAIQEATPSMRDLSEETGITYSTLRAWSAGNRIPSPEMAETLADALEHRGGKLNELADELREAAES